MGGFVNFLKGSCQSPHGIGKLLLAGAFAGKKKRIGRPRIYRRRSHSELAGERPNDWVVNIALGKPTNGPFASQAEGNERRVKIQLSAYDQLPPFAPEWKKCSAFP
jgi:hypothetical protein